MTDITVLCVDDEESILKYFKRLFRKEKLRVLTACGGEEGLDILAREEVHVVASDQKMPGMSGSQFLAKVRRQYRDVIRLSVSGYADADSIRNSILDGGIDRFLTKPWEKDQLVTSFEQCVDQFCIMERDRYFAKQSGMDPRVVQQLEQLRVQTIAELITAESFDVSSIQRLPIPTITTDRNGTVVSIHEAVGRLWSSLAELGAGDSFFSSDLDSLTDLLRAAIKTERRQPVVNDLIDYEPVLVHAVPLIIENHCEGCVMLIEHGVTAVLPETRELECVASA
jgi:response regulator RpfG family c-di-GMP phosphodiesterase